MCYPSAYNMLVQILSVKWDQVEKVNNQDPSIDPMVGIQSTERPSTRV